MDEQDKPTEHPIQSLTLREALAQGRIIYARLQAEIEEGLQAEARYWAFLDENMETGE